MFRFILIAVAIVSWMSCAPTHEGIPVCTEDTLGEYALVCDVEASRHLLEYASSRLGGDVVRVELIVLFHGDVADVFPVSMEDLENYEAVDTYIDEDGVEITVWHYEFSLTSCELTEFFCGKEFCSDYLPEFDFWKYEDGHEIFNIMFTWSVCTLRYSPGG